MTYPLAFRKDEERCPRCGYEYAAYFDPSMMSGGAVEVVCRRCGVFYTAIVDADTLRFNLKEQGRLMRSILRDENPLDKTVSLYAAIISMTFIALYILTYLFFMPSSVLGVTLGFILFVIVIPVSLTWLVAKLAVRTLNIGIDLVLSGRREEGLARIDDMLNIFPSSSVLLLQRGMALNAMARFEEALPSLDMAIDLNPDNELAICVKCEALHFLGRTPEAVDILKRLVQRGSKNPHVLYNYRYLLSVMEKMKVKKKGVDGPPPGDMAPRIGIKGQPPVTGGVGLKAPQADPGDGKTSRS